MKTPEEIKKALECCARMTGCAACPYIGEKCALQVSVDTLAYIQQLEAQVPKWYSVNDREPDGECLAVGKYGDMLIGYVYLKGKEFWCENEHEILYDITHWIPLPEPPKEG